MPFLVEIQKLAQNSWLFLNVNTFISGVSRLEKIDYWGNICFITIFHNNFDATYFMRCIKIDQLLPYRRTRQPQLFVTGNPIF